MTDEEKPRIVVHGNGPAFGDCYRLWMESGQAAMALSPFRYAVAEEMRLRSWFDGSIKGSSNKRRKKRRMARKALKVRG